MYKPLISYSDSLVKNLVEIEHYKTIINGVDLSYGAKSKLGNMTKTLNLFYFAKYIGKELTLKEAEKISKGAVINLQEDSERIVIWNVKNILEFKFSSLADSYSDFDSSILRQINKTIVNKWKGTNEARFRSLQDNVDEKWDNFVKYHDRSIQNSQVEAEVVELAEWNSYNKPIVSEVIRVGIICLRLIEIAPFIAGNIITNFVTLDYLLYKLGYSNKIYFSTLKFLQQNQEALAFAFENYTKSKNTTTFLETFVSELKKELIRIRESIDEFVKEDEKSRKQPFLDLNKRQLKVLKYLQTVPTIKREDYCHMMDVSTMTAFRDLKDLLRKKLIKTDGQGRGTKYRLATM